MADTDRVPSLSTYKQDTAWPPHNQRQLQRALETVHQALLRHVGRVQPRQVIPDLDRDEPELPSEVAVDLPPAALAVLCSAYNLTPFERDILVLCAGVELDAEFAMTCSAAQGVQGRCGPTFGLALAALPDAHWSALAPQAPLRRGCLLEVLPDESLTTSRLRIEERVLHYLLGLPGRDCLDPRLRGLVAPVAAPAKLASAQLTLAQHMASCVLRASHPAVKILLGGADAASCSAVATRMCAELGIDLYTLRASFLPSSPSEQDQLCRLWEREVRLEGAALLIQIDEDSGPDDTQRTARTLLDHLPGLVVLSCREGLRSPAQPMLRFVVPELTRSEQRELWQQSLGAVASELGEQIETFLTHFNLGPSAIASVTATTLTPSTIRPTTAAELAPALWESCRLHSRPRLDELAQRIEIRARWDELVLPPETKQLLRAIVDHKQHQATVQQRWGFARHGGRGLSALFVGASGTGKTLAAEVLAGELKLDLYRIDLSQIVSKYIGETEKHLRRVFAAAEQGGAVLLFDEADALFGKRSEVKDSHDRYANLEVGYLLQRMETYQGICILTSNMRSAIDRAFLRRLRFIVHFPLPGEEQRHELWQRVFPAATPMEPLALAKLAQLKVAGGDIHNIALTAAFSAAAAGVPLGMSHLLSAARLEYAKLEKVWSEDELGALS